MTTLDTTQDTKSANRNNRAERLSPDGKWRSFPKVPNLLQYVSTEQYYARVKVNRKQFRRSLGTKVFSTAKLKLGDFIKKHHEPTPKRGTVGLALKNYLRGLLNSHDISPQTERYRLYCVRALLKSWPGLRMLPIEKLTLQATSGEVYKTETAFLLCQEWANRFTAIKDAQYFNNTLSVLRAILEIGGVPKDGNPARRIKRLGVKPTELHLPETGQFNQMLGVVESSGAGQAQQCADLMRFLAFSGCRISEARKVTWADVDLGRGEIRVWNAKRSKRSNASQTRQVPVIPPMRELLGRLQKSNPVPSERVCALSECEKSLARACKLVGVARLTHHDLRHLFATRCIEAGVDIPTVSRWLGHQDGGALAMKVYGHLRREHSAAMAQKGTFGMGAQAEVTGTPPH